MLRATLQWIKFKLKQDPDIEAELTKRKKECDRCVFNSKHAKSWYKTLRVDDHCLICKCNLALKKYDLQASCAIKQWNETNPGLEMTILWHPYSKTTVDGKSES